MASDYTGNASGATLTVSLMTGGDQPTAQLFRVPLERCLDNDASLTSSVALLSRRILLSNALRTRPLVIEAGGTITDTANSLGAVQSNGSVPIVAVKTAQAFRVSDCGIATAPGVPASITSLVTDAASDGSRILVIGTGGNRCAFTDNNGASWTAGGNVGATPKRLVWNDSESVFLATTGTTDVRFSADGTAWTPGTSPGVEAAAGLAVMSNGDVYGISSLNAIRRSTNGGAAWSTLGSAVPNAGSLDDSGSVAGWNDSVIYHCGRFSTGARIQVASTPDGTTWTLRATLSPPSATTFTARPRLMQCQTTGLLVVVAPSSVSNSVALYASFDGDNWSNPIMCHGTSVGVDAFAVAGGRLLWTSDATLCAADGLGS